MLWKEPLHLAVALLPQMVSIIVLFIGIYLPSRYGDTLENRNTYTEDLEVSLEIASGCADRHVALKVALLENKAIQMWRVRDRRLAVISAKNALSEDDGSMCLDENHRWRSADTIAWLRTHGLYSVSNSIKAEIGDLVYNRDRGRASNDPPPGLWWLMLPMSRRLNREFCADVP